MRFSASMRRFSIFHNISARRRGLCAPENRTSDPGIKPGRSPVRILMLSLLFATMATTSYAGDEDADCSGESCQAVFRGFFSFLDRQLHGLPGNGRACADCHMPADNFQLSPAHVEARFRFLQARRQWNRYADDPLFRALDADDFRVNGAQ